MLVTIGWSLRAAQQDLGTFSLDTVEQRGGLREAVAPSLRHVTRAHQWARSPVLAPLRPLGVVGDQVDGLRAITGRLDRLARSGERALDEVEAGLDATGEPGGRLRLVRRALDAVRDVQTEVRASPPVDDDRLLGPLRTASRRLDTELDELPERLGELAAHLETAAEVLEGPTRVLLLAANNAEMKAGMGMHLSAGVITVQDGDFETSPFFPTGDAVHVTEGRAEVPAELEAMYGRIWDFGREWRTTSTTPDFRTVGRILTDLAARSPAGEVDMVVSLDVPALAKLLAATGPVVVDGEQVTAANAVDLLLRENYLRLGHPSESSERRNLQSRIANVIFDTVTERDVDVVDLAAALTEAADGRHLLGWSADPGVQALWEALGADGALTERGFLVAAQNASASKRDFYLDPDVTVVPLDPPGTAPAGRRRYRATLRLENPRVEPSVPYIDSLNRYVPVGVHRAFVTFTLPGAARDIRVVEGKESTIGTDGPTRVANVWLRVPVESTGSAAVEFSLPAGLRRVDLVPGARVRPTTHRFGPVVVTDATARTVALPLVAETRPDEPEPLAAAAVLLVLAGAVQVVSRSRRLDRPDPDVSGARLDGQLAVAAGVLAVVLGVAAGLA